MGKITVFYDFHEERKHPVLMSIRIADGALDWSRTMLYVRLTAPFQELHLEEIPEDAAGLSVLLEDLVVSDKHSHSVGIHLTALKQRHAHLIADFTSIDYLWLRMYDIEEVLEATYPFQSSLTEESEK
ncbi:hypothetical protein [Paenibacillus aestuarii]|uniref:Uncharacterized protein n=1 Tax=Paenibacillus aestuarii TaxID=516965 RepID=A0ABW0KBM7_9BACL|nr:hypothetical protein [Paenibacillus aestuarii]